MILTNARIGADEAERIGLVTAPSTTPIWRTRRSAPRRRWSPPRPPRRGRAPQLLLEGATATLRDHLEAEAATIAAAGAHPESREGVAAFLARRKPIFLEPDHGRCLYRQAVAFPEAVATAGCRPSTGRPRGQRPRRARRFRRHRSRCDRGRHHGCVTQAGEQSFAFGRNAVFASKLPDSVPAR